MFTRSLRLAVVLFGCLPAAAPAAPRDDLLRLVPDDFTFCLVVQNLRDHAQSNEHSRFLMALAKSPLLGAIQATPEAKKAREALETILKELGVSVDQVRDDLLGDAVVLVYRKGPAGQPDHEDGLAFVHARDEELLARLVGRVNEIQKKSGELDSVEPVEFEGGRYFRRVHGPSAQFYALNGHQLIVSTKEEGLRAVLTRRLAEKAGEPEVVRRMKTLGIIDAPVSLVVNPRSFDADIAVGAKAVKESERAFLSEFGKYWKAVDSVAVFARTAPTAEIGVALSVRPASLPKSAAMFFGEAGKRSPLWSAIPDDALFALVSRFHAESFADSMQEFLPVADRKKVLDGLGHATRPFTEADDIGPLIRGLGPDLGLWVTKPDVDDKTWVPRAILAVKVAPGDDGKRAEAAVMKSLDFLMRLACFLSPETRLQTLAKESVTAVSHPSFPPGFRPCFGSKGGYLLVGSSPLANAGFTAPLAGPANADEVPVIRLSVTGWRAYLQTHQKEIARFFASAGAGDETELVGKMSAILPMFDGLDRIELVQKTGPDRVMLLLRVRDSRK